jgi:hypothetical protein
MPDIVPLADQSNRRGSAALFAGGLRFPETWDNDGAAMPPPK